MHWQYLLIASAFEIAWVVCLKYSQGFTRLVPASLALAAMLASFGFLALAVRGLPMGTAYAVWTGIGAAGVAACGIVFFQESRDLARLAGIALIVIGLVVVRLTAR